MIETRIPTPSFSPFLSLLHSLDEGEDVPTEDLVVVAPFEDGEATTLALEGRPAHEAPHRAVVLRGKEPAPIGHMIVEARRHADDIPRLRGEAFLDGRHVCPRIRGRGIEDCRIAFSAEDIDRAVAEVQIEIEDEGVGDGPFPVQPLQGDGHVVEVAEAPGAPGRGVVSGRSDESEARLDEAQFRSLNGAASGKGGDFIQSLCASRPPHGQVRGRQGYLRPPRAPPSRSPPGPGAP